MVFRIIPDIVTHHPLRINSDSEHYHLCRCIQMLNFRTISDTNHNFRIKQVV